VGNYQQKYQTLWRNDSGGTLQTITGNGNSANTLETHFIGDVLVIVTVGTPTGTNPTLVVGVDMQDGAGNWIAQVIKTSTLNSAGTTVLSGGLHGSPQIVLTGYCRISWVVGGTNPVFPGVQITFGGR
jgi:hypothetical protein